MGSWDAYGTYIGGREDDPIDKIPEADIPKEHVGCGIDPSGRAFMAIRYVCFQVQNGITTMARGVLAMYERRAHNPYDLGSGGRDAKGCRGGARYLNPGTGHFLSRICYLLNGQPMSVSDWDGDMGQEQQYTVQLCNRRICPQPEAGLSWPQWVGQLFR